MGRTVHRARRRWSWPVAACLGLLIGYWSVVAFVVSVDPLDIFTWGKTPERSPDAFVAGREGLIPSIVKDPTVDLLLLGGSTTVPYANEQLRTWIPGVTNPENLSYNSPRPGDQALVLDYIEKHSRAARLIVTYNSYYSEELGAPRPSFPSAIFKDDPESVLRSLSPHLVSLAVTVARNRPLYEGDRGRQARERRAAKIFARFQTPSSMAEVGAALRRTRPLLRTPAPQACEAYPAVTRLLVPFVRRMSERGTRIDIMMPAYSSAHYGYWLSMSDARSRFGTSLMERDLAARRCVVELLDQTPNVRMVAFENDRWIIDDLGNYQDSVHLHSLKAAQFMFSHLDSDSRRLTRDNVKDYVEGLRERALSYEPFNTYIGYGDED